MLCDKTGQIFTIMLVKGANKVQAAGVAGPSYVIGNQKISCLLHRSVLNNSVTLSRLNI